MARQPVLPVEGRSRILVIDSIGRYNSHDYYRQAPKLGSRA